MSTPAGRIINRFSQVRRAMSYQVRTMQIPRFSIQDIFTIDFEWPLNLLDGLAVIVMLSKVPFSFILRPSTKSFHLVGTLVFIFIPVREFV